MMMMKTSYKIVLQTSVMKLLKLMNFTSNRSRITVRASDFAPRYGPKEGHAKTHNDKLCVCRPHEQVKDHRMHCFLNKQFIVSCFSKSEY